MVKTNGPSPPPGLDEPDENGDTVDSTQISLTMEKDLELFLCNEIQSLDPTLDLPEELESRQYTVSSGRIDILAKDTSGAYVVIELKAGTAKDQSLTQILAYYGRHSRPVPIRNKGNLGGTWVR